MLFKKCAILHFSYLNITFTLREVFFSNFLCDKTRVELTRDVRDVEFEMDVCLFEVVRVDVNLELRFKGSISTFQSFTVL